MGKLLLKMLALVMMAMPLSMYAQNNVVPLADVVATQNDSNVEVIWSWSEIHPEMMMVDFETGDFSQADFFNDETFPWAITTDAYDGSYAIKSTCEGVSNGVSAIEITVDVPYDGTMSFYHKVDCEYYYDNARFFIDGVERSLITDNVDWEYKEFKVKKGVHTYRWTYRKDESDYEISADAYFIDNIVLFKKEVPFAGGWIHYDDDHYINSIGSETGFIEWGICFPDTDKYAGYELSKIALYDDASATVKANIYFGGVNAPQNLVASEEFKLTTSKTVKEMSLSTPVEITGDEPLWITFSCSEPIFVATMCNYIGDNNSDWVNFGDANQWQHLTEMNDGLYQYSWIVRGFLQNNRGETAVLSKERTLQNYKVYRTNHYTNETKLIAENVTDTTYIDAEWTQLGIGSYQWGVAAVYNEGDAEIVWSNTIDKDMYTTVNVSASTNGSDNPAGIKVKLANVKDPDYYYRTTLDETGSYTFEKFRKGTYNCTISLEGFETYSQENIEIIKETDLNCVLKEILAAVENLYVSPTGWAKWENRNFDNGGGRFFFDFEDGLLDGWRTIDADGDGYNWRLTTEIMGPGYGYNQSRYCVISQSYNVDTIGALTPDNYLITTDKYLITDESQLTYYVCAQDEQAPAEHYAVLVSTTSDTLVEEFTTVWEETLARGSKSTRNGRGQGAWYKRTIDLRYFAGQEVYIAFRHFNSTNQFYVNLDNITLVNNAKSVRKANDYTVKLNGETVADNVKTNYYQFENLIEGETYTASVIANYTSGESDAAEYTWTSVSPENYEGTTSLKGRSVAGKAFLHWTLPGDEISQEAENSFFFDFNDGTLDGWRNIDADGDGYVWYNSSEKLGAGYGYKDSIYCIVSHSYYSGQFNFSLTPDNYLVTEKKYAITENSKLSFVVCAQDPNYYEEHYGVAVSLIDNATADDFVTIWEETLESDDTDYQTPQTNWETKTIDLSQYAGEEIYIALRHFNCTDQYMLDIDNVALVSDSKSNRNDNDILGVMIYCDGELLTEEIVTNKTYITDFPGNDEYEYCVKVVYSDYGMSMPQCVTIDAPISCDAPRDLYGEIAVRNGKTGVSLIWPYELPPTSEWLYYDNGTPKSSMGMSGNPFYWAVMFPVEKLQNYIGTSITKVMTYDVIACDATVLISYGSLSQPGDVLVAENFMFEGVNDWIEIELSQPVPVTGKDYIWVMIYQNGAQYPAVFSDEPADDPNGRWISMDGMQWYDLKSLGDYDYAWVLRAFVTNEIEPAKELQEIEFHAEAGNSLDINISDKPIISSPRNVSELKHYNIYRGFDLDDMEIIDETSEGSYFDVVSNGLYYYQVTSVYEDNGETCESEPAKSFNNPNQNYVMVEVMSVDEDGINAVMIYPNPAKENLTVNAEGMTRITITNTLGQVVYDNNAVSNNEVIDMNQYETGIYMVRIETENGSIVRKVSKL